MGYPTAYRRSAGAFAASRRAHSAKAGRANAAPRYKAANDNMIGLVQSYAELAQAPAGAGRFGYGGALGAWDILVGATTLAGLMYYANSEWAKIEGGLQYGNGWYVYTDCGYDVGFGPFKATSTSCGTNKAFDNDDLGTLETTYRFDQLYLRKDAGPKYGYQYYGKMALSLRCEKADNPTGQPFPEIREAKSFPVPEMGPLAQSSLNPLINPAITPEAAALAETLPQGRQTGYSLPTLATETYPQAVDPDPTVSVENFRITTMISGATATKVSGAGSYRFRPPRHDEVELKRATRAVVRPVLKLVDQLTEGMDFIRAVYHALPPRYQYAHSWKGMVGAVVAAAYDGNIPIGRAAENLFWQQMDDMWVGLQNKPYNNMVKLAVKKKLWHLPVGPLMLKYLYTGKREDTLYQHAVAAAGADIDVMEAFRTIVYNGILETDTPKQAEAKRRKEYRDKHRKIVRNRYWARNRAR